MLHGFTIYHITQPSLNIYRTMGGGNKILLVRHEPYGTTTFTNKQLNEKPSDPIVPLGVVSALVQLGQTSVKWAWGPSRVASLRRHVLKILLRNPNLNPQVLFNYSYHFISHFSFSFTKKKHHLNPAIISKRQIQRMRSMRSRSSHRSLPSFQAAQGTQEALGIDGIDGFVRGQRCQHNDTLLSNWENGGYVDVRMNLT